MQHALFSAITLSAAHPLLPHSSCKFAVAACNNSTTTRVKTALSASLSQFNCFSRTDKVYPGKLDRRDELFCGLWCAASKPAMADTQEGPVPGLALLGAGVFASTQYVPKLGSLGHLVSLKVIWSRSKESALEGLQLARPNAPDIQAKWGSEGLQAIFEDKSIHAVAVVLPAQAQLDIVIRALKAGKHVIQEKPVGPTVAEVRKAWLAYQALATRDFKLPIWAVAENYRFEPALVQAANFVKEAGTIMNVQVSIEAPMNSSNPYFSSTWRRDPNFKGGFMIDGGVHFVAGLRMIVGCEVASVSAISTHVDQDLPPPDNMSALLQLWNGSTGVMNVSYSATSRKVSWRVVGSLGTVEAERGVQDGQHGYKAVFYPMKGTPKESFTAFEGVQEELRVFVEDVTQCIFKGKSSEEADKRSSVLEALRDVAVIEAMLSSSERKGTPGVVELGLDGSGTGSLAKLT